MREMTKRDFVKAALGASGVLLLPPLRNALKSVPANHFTPESGKLQTISVHIHPGMLWQKNHADAIMAGFRRHGLQPYYADFNVPVDSDLAVIWSWKQFKLTGDVKRRGAHVLVMEDGFIQPRHEWCSLAADGFNGRGKFIAVDDHGERWNKHFAHLLQPWRTDRQGYALMIGQAYPVKSWERQMAAELAKRHMPVMYRPHPLMRPYYAGANPRFHAPDNTTMSQGSLAEDLRGAAYCLTYNSDTVVESVLAGVPTLAFDEGSIGWPMTSHDLDRPFFMPERLPWCHDMAWRQWTMNELADGSAWEHMKKSFAAS